MNKYNEIMNHIEMDDERRSRILEGINLQLENKITETEEKSEKKTSGISVKWIVAASVAASVLIIAIPLNFFRIDPDNPDGPTIEMPEETTVSSDVYESDIFSETDISSVPSSSVTESEGNETTESGNSPPVPVTVPETAAGISPSPSASPSHSPAPVNTPSPSVKPPSQTTENEEPDESGPPALWTQPPSLTDPSSSEEPPEVTEPDTVVLYDSLEEMNEATGYKVSHLPWLPFKTTSHDYSSFINDNLISYIAYSADTGDSVFFTTSSGHVVSTGDYDGSSVVSVNGKDVTIYTESGYISEAEWFDGTYWHSVSLMMNNLSETQTKEIMLKIISAQLNQ